MPVLALAYAAFLVINVTFFHLLPMIISGGKFSPGIISGILLFYPIGYYAYSGSGMPQTVIVWSIVIGAAVILWPVLLLKIRQQPYFRPGAADAGPVRKASRRR
jgi:RsiW-degrading membrane proteinase PrsW (M82 family)